MKRPFFMTHNRRNVYHLASSGRYVVRHIAHTTTISLCKFTVSYYCVDFFPVRFKTLRSITLARLLQPIRATVCSRAPSWTTSEGHTLEDAYWFLLLGDEGLPLCELLVVRPSCSNGGQGELSDNHSRDLRQLSRQLQA